MSPKEHTQHTLSNESSILVRPATTKDLPGIFSIYDHEVLHSTATFDTVIKSVEERLEWFDIGGGKYPIYVAVPVADPDRILGWCRLYPYSPRRAYDRTAEVAVYTHVNARGQGIAKILLQCLIDACPSIGVHVLLAKITAENVESIRLHEKYGFKTFGVLPRAGEKYGRVLDVTFMSLQLES